MVNFDVSSRLELSRLEIIHADTQVALSIDLKLIQWLTQTSTERLTEWLT